MSLIPASKLQASAARRPLRRWSLSRLLLNLSLSALGWGVVALACCCVGSTGHIGWPATIETLRPRSEVVLISSLVGAALGAAGVAYQAMLRNPLADPYLLGVSSGASLASYVWQFQLVAVAMGPLLSAVSQQAFAFVGAMISVLIVFWLASGRGRLEPVTLLLVGVIVNAINGAIFLFLNLVHPEMSVAQGGPLGFLVGAIQTNLTVAQKEVAVVVIGMSWLALLYLGGALNAGAIGEDEAEALGVRVHRLRFWTLIIASVMTATAVAISGPIGFIGLICPHLCRLIVGADHRRLLPISAAAGAALLCVADAGCRLLSSQQFQQTLIPVGVLTSLMGGPFFLLMLWRQRRGTGVRDVA